MTYQQAKEHKEKLEQEVKDASLALRAFGDVKMPNGLTPDNVKASPAYRAAKGIYNVAFRRLQAFNSVFCKRYKNEYREDRGRS